MESHSLPQAQISANFGWEKLPFPSTINTTNEQEDRADLSKLAAKVLEDPMLLQMLSDRVYQLMLEDLRNQRERHGNFGGLL
ncbi:MAG: hypothetical protein U7123_04835 [Potamolinea sp.]